MKRPKRRHLGRQAVLLTPEATTRLKEAARIQDRSLNKTASRAIVEWSQSRP